MSQSRCKIRQMEKNKSFSNQEIAKILEKVAAAYEILDKDRFRIAAYERASVSIQHATSEVKDIWDDDKLDDIPGIGKSIASYLDELFRTGKVRHFEELFKKIPPSVFIFLDIPGVGPKTAYTLAEKLNIREEKNAIARLKTAAQKGKIEEIENFGEKSELDILNGISVLEKGELKTKRMLLFYADALADEIIDYLKKSNEVIRADPLGSLRRKVATVGDIDISVCTNNPQKAIEYFLNYKKIKEVISRGEESLVRVVLFSGQQVDLRFSTPEKYGSMLQYFTGSKQHNILLREFALKKDLSLSEYGIKTVKNLKTCPELVEGLKIKNFKDEENFYNFLGLEWIPPELREGTEEIKTSLNGKLPKLIELKEIKGDLHLHSNFNLEPSHDLGQSSVGEMLIQAGSLNYEYLGFSEHNPSVSNHSEREIYDLIMRKKEFIEQEYYSTKNKDYERGIKLPKQVLNSLEIDIKPNGNLAVDEKCLNILDYAIASVHSSFNQKREKMTDRVLKGLSHPKIKILGHPTGRLLLEREGYELDWDKIFDFCLKNNKFLEINSWPNRLDLPDTKVKEAVKYGVKLVINSDSHHVNQMAYLQYGVSVARRGWAEKKDIINSLSFEGLSDILL
ncbi:hypothetical protein COS55_03890 [Candidatus Shapirobacteria bacterium CG03_land_8_20_14_0_80_40_19]|nr:MAG: hypothetical protein COS55_03890 [Candidatus Shapirobacteria bacterium CG03_land_8_20_14_0_80_40_19]PJC29070.1 MAG: hypothetical protein CO053_01205 [Candidatus Shapirobacteria bacterium CG_4_9_14_0_2_um_filter_40_11]PJC76844.1 MAG: hypothetical protein CO010_01615 [Candidatus Shapirobacteria bacterium CG_4_8_14_3_um_filter_39_11]